MIGVEQKYLQALSRTERLIYRVTADLFKMDQSLVDRKVQSLIKEMAATYKNDLYPRCSLQSFFTNLWEVLPLLLENAAISRFVKRRNDVQLRMALPEILSPIEAKAILRMEHPSLCDQDLNLMGKFIEYWVPTLEKVADSVSLPDISIEQALRIAQADCTPPLEEMSVYDPPPVDEMRIYDSPFSRLGLYNVKLDEPCWYVYIPQNNEFSGYYMLKSSHIVIISKATGKVLYNGSAYDEG